jgi:hypothetical protein
LYQWKQKANKEKNKLSVAVCHLNNLLLHPHLGKFSVKDTIRMVQSATKEAIVLFVLFHVISDYSSLFGNIEWCL